MGQISQVRAVSGIFTVSKAISIWLDFSIHAQEIHNRVYLGRVFILSFSVLKAVVCGIKFKSPYKASIKSPFCSESSNSYRKNEKMGDSIICTKRSTSIKSSTVISCLLISLAPFKHYVSICLALFDQTTLL